MNEDSQKSSTRVFSVRLPWDEAERIDALARKSGLVRNDYIRLCLKESSAFIDTDALASAVDELRRLEQLLEGYLDRLDRLSAAARRQGWDVSSQQLILGEMERAERLSEALFKAQRSSVRVLNAVRKKVGR